MARSALSTATLLARLPLLTLALGLALVRPSLAQSDGDPVLYPPGHYRVLTSEILEEERTLLISLPQGYETSTRRYPVLFLLDGSGYSISWARGSALERGIPPLITVAIANTDRRRDLSLLPVEAWGTEGGAEAFLEFIVRELVPFIDREYRTAPYRIIAGTSSAGFLTVFSLLAAPEVFDAFIAASPMFAGVSDRVLAEAEGLRLPPSERRGPKQLVLLWGELDYPGATLLTPPVATALENAAGPGLEVWQQVLEDKGHGQFASLNVGLTRVFRDFGFPTEDFLLQGPVAAEERLLNLENRLGIPLQPQEAYTEIELVLQGCGLMASERFAEAQRLLEFGLTLFPDSPRLLYRLGQAQVFSGLVEEGWENLARASSLDPGGGIGGMVELWRQEWAGR